MSLIRFRTTNGKWSKSILLFYLLCYCFVFISAKGTGKKDPLRDNFTVTHAYKEFCHGFAYKLSHELFLSCRQEDFIRFPTC